MDKNLAPEIVGKYGIFIAISIILLLSVVDIFFVSVARPRIEQSGVVKTEVACQSSGDEVLKKIPTISEIKGPMISSEGAFSTCQSTSVSVCQNLDNKAWIFLLVSYIALLVFNLGFGFLKNGKLQWGWEVAMTGIFLAFWFIFDACASSLWYPLYVVKLGIAIYVLYFYFFLKKMERIRLEGFLLDKR